MPADIQNPRRILAVALTSSRDHLSSIIGKLTGTYPSGEFAGSTHDLTLDTPYYHAQVPVWLDLVGEAEEAEMDKKNEKTEKSPYDDSDDDDDNDPVQTWADAFLADEASEVREALGGIVAIVDASSYKQQKSLVNHVGRLARGCAPKEEGEAAEEMQGLTAWDGVGLVVGVSATPLDDDAMLAWDDVCVEAGLEFVLVAPGQADINEWGEKTGVARVLEALKANDWQGDDGGSGDIDVADVFGEDAGSAPPTKKGCSNCGNPNCGDDVIVFCPGPDSSDEESIDFTYDRSDTEGLRQAIWEQQNKEIEDDEEEEDKNGANDKDKTEDKAEKEKPQEDNDKDDDDMDITKLIQKLQAAKMQGELLPPAQRRALAARVVSEVMKEI